MSAPLSVETRRQATTTYRVGQRVRTAALGARSGYHNLPGRVVKTHLGEIGVTFASDPEVITVDAWFLPAELVKQ